MRIARPSDALDDVNVKEAIRRGVIAVDDSQVKYVLNQQRSYDWRDPEEWVRAVCIAWLVIDREYPAARLRTEVTVPRRTPSDSADIVVYRDDRCTEPYLVVEAKADRQSAAARKQGIEQLFGNANSLRAPLGLYFEGSTNAFFDVANYPPTERAANRRGDHEGVPKQYGDVPAFRLVAGGALDIRPLDSQALESCIRRAHSAIWAGGKRDPLTAFDEWSKVLFAKVIDERRTRNGTPRRFQVGANETSTAVANRIHGLFREACQEDPEIFPAEVRIGLPDGKIVEVVEVLENAAFTRTDADTIGHAFERFFGSIFRGGLGQYFTMRQLARFTVGVLDVTQADFVLDPTVGSGGFLLEVLLQVWHQAARDFEGQGEAAMERLRLEFARSHVYGIEIHEVLARICKINLLLHHDGHTNIEAGRSCLDIEFDKARLKAPFGRFTCVVGNPPFGDAVEEGDDDKLGSNTLESFAIATGRAKAESEHLIVERVIAQLEPSGRFGLILPDGILNNQGEQSNCPQLRRLLASTGMIEAIVSLPDFAFRKSGAQNKTSVLFYRKFSAAEKRAFDRAADEVAQRGEQPTDRVLATLRQAGLSYYTFLAEANAIGYSSTGQPTSANELYASDHAGALGDDQSGTVLGEWRKFRSNPIQYQGFTKPDCMALEFADLWQAHSSNRLDPKYHLFQREAHRELPPGWVRTPIRAVMQRRSVQATPEEHPEFEFLVLTLAQTGEIRPRAAGKGKNPPSWQGSYFEGMPSRWFAAEAGDVVYSSIDLWKGCISLVPPAFAGGLVTKEYPIYEITDRRLSPEFLQALLRTRYYQRAFRAITTGHSNRRRTQQDDFEALAIAFPESPEEQARLVASIVAARGGIRRSTEALNAEMHAFSNLIDGRGDEELPEIAIGEESGEEVDDE